MFSLRSGSLVRRVGSPLRALISFVFQTSLVTYSLYYLIEALFPKSISPFLNLSVLFWLTLLLGLIEFSFQSVPHVAKTGGRRSARNAGLILLGLAVACVVWIGTKALEGMAIPIALLTGLLVVLVLKTSDDDEGDAPQSGE